MDFGSDLLRVTAALKKMNPPSEAMSGRLRMASAAAVDDTDRADAAGWKTMLSCWKWRVIPLPSPFLRQRPDVHSLTEVPVSGEHLPFRSFPVSICSWLASLKWRLTIQETRYHLQLFKEEKKKNCSLLWRRIGLVNTFTNNVVTNRQEGMNRQTRADAAGVVRAGMSEGLRSVRARWQSIIIL